MFSLERNTVTFIKLTDIWSGDFYVNPVYIKLMTGIVATGKNGAEAKTFIKYGDEDAARVTQSIEEIMETINNVA